MHSYLNIIDFLKKLCYIIYMAKLNFYQQRDIKNRVKMGKYTEKLPDYCMDFFIGIENNTSSLTRYNYAMDLYIFFNYLANYVFHKKENEITLDDLNKLKSRNLEQYLSYLSYYEMDGKQYRNDEKGKARKLASLRSFFKYLFNHDMIESNVASKIDTPKIHNKEIIRLENDEVKKLMETIENPIEFTKHQKEYNKQTFERDNAIITLFLGTGIRISELVGLNVESFDFSQNAFLVTRKGGNQTTLYFSKEVALALKTWLEKRATLNLPEDENAMFISLQNKRISIKAVENLVKKYAQIASPLKKISPHKLRSTFGTNLYKETRDIYIVADVLGHKDVNTTKKHYAAISEDMRKSVADVIKINS